MECESLSIMEEVPPPLISAATASATFYAIPRPLYVQEEVQQHTICATKQGQVVEVDKASNIIRIVHLSPTEVNKIVVHHEFGPRQLYVVLLYKTNKAVILSYKDFKVVYECDDVADVSSEDPGGVGVPQLHFTYLSGAVEIIPSRRVLLMCRQRKGEEVEKIQPGVREALDAMAKNFRNGIRQTEQLRGQRCAKERYIQGVLSALQVQLAGQNQEYTTTLMPALSLLGEKRQEETAQPPPPKPPPLKVLGIRQKLVYDKWVIGIDVVNEGDRVVVHNPLLVLCPDSEADTITYRSCTLRSVRRGSSSGSSDPPHPKHIAIEPLQPPVLRPGKRACVLAICEMPAFLSGPTVTCSGLLTYTCRSLSAHPTQPLVCVGGEEVGGEIKKEVQASIGMVQLRVDQLSTHQVSLDQDPLPGGVSFSSVALVAASITSKVCLTTLYSPLTNIITCIMQHYSLTKVCGLSDFYCFYPDQPHPLRHSAFAMTLPHPHTAQLTLYTRDKTQAVIMIQSLLSVLPSDISVDPYVNSALDYKETKKMQHRLHIKICEAVSGITEGYEKQLEKNQRKKARLERRVRIESPKETPKSRDAQMVQQQEAYQRSSESEEEKEGAVTFSSEEYSIWRRNLKDIQSEIDQLYVNYIDHMLCVKYNFN